MLVASREAVEKARKGGGATLIEAVTYRMSVHTTADDPTRYRAEGEVAEWERRDPIMRFQTYLKNRGLLDDEKIAAIEAEIAAEVQAAVERAEARMSEPVDPLTMFDHVYAEPPAHLLAQRAELARELSAVKGA